tara:strand:+ start:997 stop:1389 length:393 start_codon:yes stop_codon:yes gene_type:complete
VVPPISAQQARADLELPLLLDLGPLTNTISEVVELGPSDISPGSDLDAIDDRRMDRESPLDSNAEAKFADSESLADAASLTLDDHTLEKLNALSITFNDADMHLQRVASGKVWYVVAKILQIDKIGGLHV